MAKPLVARETIYDSALQLLDREGPEALNARNLAAAVGCSTRTLYQQVGKREQLITKLIEHHFEGRELEFERGEAWQQSASNWANTLRVALFAHPNLARLMTVEHRAPVAHYVTELLKVLLQAGFPEELALRSSRVLVNITMSLTLSELNTPAASPRRARRSKEEIQFEDLVISRTGKDRDQLQSPPEVFANTISWVIQGINTELTAA